MIGPWEGSFRGECGASHCNQWGVCIAACVAVRKCVNRRSSNLGSYRGIGVLDRGPRRAREKGVFLGGGLLPIFTIEFPIASRTDVFDLSMKI